MTYLHRKQCRSANVKKSSTLCCFCFGPKRAESLVSIGDLDEPCEYVVEKLVIKRIPVKHFASEADVRDIQPCTVNQLSLKQEKSSEKPIVTFSSYCQIVPPTHALRKTQSPIKSEKNTETCTSDDNIAENKNPSPKDEMTSGRRQQLQQCTAKKWTSAQVYKQPFAPPIGKPRSPTFNDNLAENKVLFTKPMSPRDISPVNILDPAIKETLHILANKKIAPSVNRRLVSRDPDTGQIKEIFQNSKCEKPIKLDEIYKEDGSFKINDRLDGACGDNKRTNSPPRSLKWKIIVRHRNDKKSVNIPVSLSATTDSD